MVEYLRGEEMAACVHRVALSRGEPFPFTRPEPGAEIVRRRSSAERFRRSVLEELRAWHPDAVATTTVTETCAALDAGARVILTPRLPSDDRGLRRAHAHLLVRVGRTSERWTYAPVVIRHGELAESAATRRSPVGDLEHPWPESATFRNGVGVRVTASTIRVGLAVVHALAVLEAAGHADERFRGGVIDRHRALWWFDLASHAYPRFNRHAYERHYAERLAVVRGHQLWRDGQSPFPTVPAWHRECLECDYAQVCREQLEARDDVSLTRFTSLDQQALLRESGILTRRQLAGLDPARARDVRLAAEDDGVETVPARSIDNLGSLIYRARATEFGPLRITDPGRMGCPRADVEVDVDMESYDNRTYLWGALVTLRRDVPGVEAGYRSFVDWATPTERSEGDVFAAFWRWLADLRQRTAAAGASWCAYCFWAYAEDSAMTRAVSSSSPLAPDLAEIEAFRATVPPVWVDVHALARSQIQTDGPTGLKVLASHAGFHWRDASPSGEASMSWFEAACDEGGADGEARRRLLEYNEDDCRATRALREWLGGAARELPHRDGVPPGPR